MPHHSTPRRRIWCYGEADFTRAQELLNSINWNSELQAQNVNNNVSNWQCLFLQIMEMAIPHKLSRQIQSLPWINKEVILSMKKKEIYGQTELQR